MGIERLREWVKLHPERVTKNYIAPQFKRTSYSWSDIAPGIPVDFSSLSDPTPKREISRLPKMVTRWEKELRWKLDQELEYAMEHLDHGELPDPRIFSIDNREVLRPYEVPEGYFEPDRDEEPTLDFWQEVAGDEV